MADRQAPVVQPVCTMRLCTLSKPCPFGGGLYAERPGRLTDGACTERRNDRHKEKHSPTGDQGWWSLSPVAPANSSKSPVDLQRQDRQPLQPSLKLFSFQLLSLAPKNPFTNLGSGRMPLEPDSNLLSLECPSMFPSFSFSGSIYLLLSFCPVFVCRSSFLPPGQPCTLSLVRSIVSFSFVCGLNVPTEKDEADVVSEG